MTTENASVPSANEETLLAWYYLLQVSNRVIRSFEDRFDALHRTSAREFDVLINLGNAPGKRLRMTALANATVLSSGGLTRLVSRLEERGLVRREQDPVDARAFFAVLTEAGEEQLVAMRVTHDRIVAELVGTHLAPAEAATLRGLLERVLGGDRSD
jgi:DNA-binding MarR family transcriptional regulator